MFTGIIKEVGKVKKIEKKVSMWKLSILSQVVFSESNISDSISVNGACLTLVEKKNDLLFFEVIKTTLESTNLKRLKVNYSVNLEPSLKAQDKLGGHFVLGHVDCESKIKGVKRNKDFYTFEIELPKRFKHLVTEKGSIAVEGVSLTIQKIKPTSFSIDVIPYTFAH
ncbi:MAG: riboflavin synthase, partial [Candidatus Omnitrophica bacterium]|nr:riboflavin synthase [Candidatus Omnitrophota bacterium]